MATKRKRVVLTIQQKLDIVQNIERGSTVKQMCIQYNVGDSTVRDILKNKDKLVTFACSSDTNFGMANRKTMKKSTYEELDECMLEWFTQQRAQGTPVSGPICLTKAKFFFDALGMEGDFDASSGWFTRFKQRHGIRDVSIKGELLSGDVSAAQEFSTAFEQFISDEGLTPEQLYNADESGLYYKCLPSRTLAFKKERGAPGYKASKERVTIMSCSNATGDHKLPLVVIGKAKKPRSFKGTEVKSLPVHYFNQKSSWMSCDIFKTWFDNNFVPQVRKYLKSKGLQEKAVLLLDNAPSHPNELLLKSEDGKIFAKFLPPNVTAIIQPMDQGVISALKRNYRSTLLQKRIEEGSDLKGFWKDFTILDAIYEISSSWDKTKQTTIARSWKKILPDISDGPNFEGWDDDEVDKITEVIRNAPGGEEVNSENVREWLDCDKDDQGYNQLSDEQIVQKIRSGSGGEMRESGSEEEGEEEGGEAGACTNHQTVTHSAALMHAEGLLEYLEGQEDSLVADKIQLRNLRSRIKKRCFMVQKQKSMTDYFLKQ